jgi:hypothetical protein
MARANGGKLDAALAKAIADELREVTQRHPKNHEKEGQFVYGTVERMRVIDRALKLQSLKLKTDDPEWGKEFDKT